MELVYKPIPEDNPVHGVIAADAPTAQWVAKTVSAALNGGYQYVKNQNKAVVINDDELTRFDALSLEDRILVMMVAMGLNNTVGEFRATMSDAAKALAEAIDNRVAEMSDEARANRMEAVNAYFSPHRITINDVAYEAVGIVLIIDANGDRTNERYVFYNDNGIWRLYQIEVGEYITVD